MPFKARRNSNTGPVVNASRIIIYERQIYTGSIIKYM